MDADVEGNLNESVLAPKEAVGSVTVAFLHPLVTLTISDQWTRHRAQSDVTEQHQQSGQGQVFGALIGTREGRRLEIMNSFELVVSNNNDAKHYLFDNEYFQLKMEQYIQVFQTMEVLGWYRTGLEENPTQQDVPTHEQFCSLANNENCVFLKMSPLMQTSDLPVKLFESVVDLVSGGGGRTKLLFISLPWKILTEDAERIGVEHITRDSRDSGDAGSAMVAKHLQHQYSAVKSLHSRLQLILDYVKATESQEIPCNAEIMRLISKLCKQLPATNPQTSFDSAFFSSINDGILITFLGIVTKGCDQLKQLMMRIHATHKLYRSDHGDRRTAEDKHLRRRARMCAINIALFVYLKRGRKNSSSV